MVPDEPTRPIVDPKALPLPGSVMRGAELVRQIESWKKSDSVFLGRRLPLDCLYDVGRRKTRRHVEGIRHAIDASCDVDLVAFPIEAQFMICAEIDNHPGIARSRRPRLSPHQEPYLGCEQM
jgi:hypothetical protein